MKSEAGAFGRKLTLGGCLRERGRRAKGDPGVRDGREEYAPRATYLGSKEKQKI